MNISRLNAAMTLSTSAGLLLISASPATASHRILHTPPQAQCHYAPTHIKRGETVPVRSGAGDRHGIVGKLSAADTHVHGSCTATDGWLAVTTPGGTHGWAHTDHLLRKPTGRTGKGQAPTGPSATACRYTLYGVRPISYLNVRSGPGLRYHPIGKIRTRDDHPAGTCTSTNGWLAVTTANGQHGWASAHYLRKAAR
ncbi:SH3 domain-containing protein [Nonomuraea turcica]|uniref:SH3 domain-containing protein n=1 Tax=Nonomuraea sp. G32 TaxID=3067274 RepID=UPI00273C911A|nr:SH3 domain-containing protein [Nonomuraea sp. G32]MDP4501828.1 hypothetical protein [Nonomuraea sp. G32]